MKEEKLTGREKEAFGGLKEAPKRVVSQEGLKEGQYGGKKDSERGEGGLRDSTW